MQLTQQIRIKPSIAQEVILEALSEKCRLIYNFALQERQEAFREGIKGINYYKQQNDLPEIKKQYPKYRWVYSKVLQHTLRILDANYKSFFALRKNGHEEAQPPGFKGRKFFTTMVHNQSGFKIGNTWVELSHKHPTKTKLRFEIPKKFSFTDKRVYQVSIYKKDEDFYLSITYEKQENEYRDNGSYQAFDLGVTKHAAVNTKGKFVEFENARPDKYWKKPITELQSRRDHCKKGSKKRNKLHKLFSRCKQKSANQMKDFQHKLSHKIIHNTRANTIIVGDLSVKQLCQINEYEHGIHTSLYTGSIGRFVGFLTYKARLVGKRIIEINERGTSKACCACGRKHEMPLSRRVMSCDCGNVMDRDCNSSVNILLRFLSKNGLWTAYKRTVRNLRKTGILISVSYSKEAQSVRVG